MAVRRDESAKKPWRPPELIVFGSVESITQAPKGSPGPDQFGLGDHLGRSGPCG